MFKSCALVLLSCAVLVVGLSSMALSHFHRGGEVHSLVFEESETCVVSKALRRETIRALPGDRRWTREACAEHWAEGIDRVAHIKLAKKRIFLAMNLKNNEQVFDHLRGELLLLADYLGPSRLYISIFESGSSDSTPQKLQAFREELRLLQIPNMIITNGIGKRADQTRIDFLANARNLAMAPLLREIWDGPFGNLNAGKYYHGHGCCEPLSAIEVYASGSRIYGIQFSFGGFRKGRIGSPLGELFALTLKPKEVVVSVAGAGNDALTKLVVTTNLGRMLAAGNVQQKGWESTGARLEDVRGHASEKAVHALSFAWAKDEGTAQKQPRFDRVLILNDGYLCLEDILLLLMHDANMVTAVDTIGLREEEKTRRLQVYDTWVGRDVNGKEQGREFPLSNVAQFRQWCAEGKPFPVFCACHGAVNLDADVFYKKRITFRNRGWEGECAASEYSFLCKDLWRAYGNETRIVMDPRVVVGVDEPAWEDVVLARSKKLPSHFKEAPFDVGIQPSPWRKLPEIDLSFVRDTLRHLRGLKLSAPRQVTCAPIHHESPREAALIGKYEENIQGVTVYPRGPWAREAECLTEADAYPNRDTEPGQSMYYFNSAGRQVFDQKRLTIGGGDRLVSPNFQYMFIMQKNRECAMHTMTTPFKPIWRWPMCDDPSINYIEFQGDGNLVAYAFDGSVKHATGTVVEPKRASLMALGNDGHLLLRTKTGKVLWEAEREFLVEDSEWERRRPGKQIFIPVTLRGDDTELEAASAFGDICRALTGRVFFSLVTLSDTPPVASESVITAVLLEFVCSFKSSGVASTLEEANALHFKSFNEWSTGYAYSCTKAFPAVPTSFCPKSFVQEVRDGIRNPNGLEPCTTVQMDGTSNLEMCCDRPSLE